MNHRVVGAVLVVLAVALLAHPLYLWPHYGETPYWVYSNDADDGSGPAVEYESLSPKAQAAFDGGPSHRLYESTDGATIDRFETAQYVRKDGTVHRVEIAHLDDSWLLLSLVRLPLSLLGGLVAVAGLRRLRPARFGSGLWSLAGAAVGLGSLVVLDANSNATGSAAGSRALALPMVIVLVTVGTGALAGRTIARHGRGRWSVGALVGLAVLVAAIGLGPVRPFGFIPLVTVPFTALVALLGVATGYLARRDGGDDPTAAA